MMRKSVIMALAKLTATKETGNRTNLGACPLDQVTADILVMPGAKADNSLTMMAAGSLLTHTAWLLYDYRRQLYDASVCHCIDWPKSRIVVSE